MYFVLDFYHIINILLSQPSDVRHVLQTIAQRRRHSRRPIHFYISERPAECLARELLLLTIAQDWELPIRHRANTFLEVFGNICVQRRTSRYIEAKARELIRTMCDGEGPLVDQFDFSLLKFRERDELESIFKSWYEKVPFAAKELHDRRLRLLYKDRYDFRKNVIDWDYQWSLRPAASIVHIRRYTYDDD